MLAREHFDDPHVWDKPGLSGFSGWFGYSSSWSASTNKQDKPNKPIKRRPDSPACLTLSFRYTLHAVTLLPSHAGNASDA